MSVRSKILIAILAVAALGLAASGVASFLVQRERVLASVDTQLLRIVPQLGAIASGEATGTPPTSVHDLLRAAMLQRLPEAGESVLGIVDGDAALVPAVSMPFHLEDDTSFVRRALAESNQTHVVQGTAKATLGTLRYVIIPVSVAGDPASGLYIAAYNLDAELGDVALSFQTYAIVALLALAVIGLVSWYVAGRLLRPIRLLRRAAAANSAADLSARIPVTGNDDISELTKTINGMFDRLETSFVNQRRLINDVGHELKTPITIIRGHLELLDAGKKKDIDATRALAIDELDRMGRLVSEISLLAESGTPHFIAKEPVDVGELANSVIAKASALDPARTWSLESDATIVAELDQRRITQAWLQLASNAVKHSTPGGPITLGSAIIDGRNGTLLQLSVTDAGPGIPAEEHERIFERFTRRESSRGTDGSGLGLAIVSAIAQAHGGTASLSSAVGRGSRFEIRVPVSQSAEEGEQQ